MRTSFDVENIYTQHRVHQHNENIKKKNKQTNKFSAHFYSLFNFYTQAEGEINFLLR